MTKTPPSPAARALGEFLIEHEKLLRPFAVSRAEAFRDAAIKAVAGWAETYPEASARLERGKKGIDVTIYMPSVLGRISLTGGLMPPGASPRQVDAEYPGLYSEASALKATANMIAGMLDHDGDEHLIGIMMEAAEANPGDLQRSAPPRSRVSQTMGDQGWNAESMGVHSNSFLIKIEKMEAFADYLVERVRDGGQEVAIAEGADADSKLIAAQAACSMRADLYVRIAEDFISEQGEMLRYADFLEEAAKEENEAAAAYSAEMEGL